MDVAWSGMTASAPAAADSGMDVMDDGMRSDAPATHAITRVRLRSMACRFGPECAAPALRGDLI